MPDQPPPVPSQPLEYRQPTTTNEQPYTQYDRVADTVGMVPNVRWKDNLYQLVAGVCGAGLGGLVGGMMYGSAGWIMGAILGFIVGVVLWGIALGIIGLVRSRSK